MNSLLDELKKELLPLLEAAKERGVSQDYLRFLIFKKKLKGEKIGRNWVTTREWLDEYFTTVKKKNGLKIKEKNDPTPFVDKDYFAESPVDKGSGINDTILKADETKVQVSPASSSDFSRDYGWVDLSLKDGEKKTEIRVSSLNGLAHPRPSEVALGRTLALDEFDKEFLGLKPEARPLGLDAKQSLASLDQGREAIGLEIETTSLINSKEEKINSFWKEKSKNFSRARLFNEKIRNLFFTKVPQALSVLFFVRAAVMVLSAIFIYSFFVALDISVSLSFKEEARDKVVFLSNFFEQADRHNVVVSSVRQFPKTKADFSFLNQFSHQNILNTSESFSNSLVAEASSLSESISLPKFRTDFSDSLKISPFSLAVFKDDPRLILAAATLDLNNLNNFLKDNLSNMFDQVFTLTAKALRVGQALPKKLSSSVNFLVDSLVESFTPVSPKTVKPKVKELVTRDNQPSSASLEATADKKAMEAKEEAPKQEALNPKVQVREITEKKPSSFPVVTGTTAGKEVIIPADLAFVKEDFSSRLAEANLALKNFFESSISEVKNSLSKTNSRTDSNTRIITLTQKIDDLNGVTLKNITVNGVSGLSDSDIPNDISVTGAISPSTLSLSSTFTASSTASITGDLTLFSNLVFYNKATTTILALSPNALSIATSSAGVPFMTFDTSNYRVGIGTSTPGSTFSVGGNALISGTLDVGGVFRANSSSLSVNNVPTTAHTFSTWEINTGGASATTSSLVINPSSAASDTNLLGIMVANNVKFLVDAEGDVFANALTTAGSVTTGSTTNASLLIEGSAYIGDAIGDLFSINSGNIVFNNRSTSTIPNLTVDAWSIATSTTIVPTFTISTAASPFGLVGIGTTSPFASLSIEAPSGHPAFAIGSSSATSFIVDRNSNIGIGTSSPGTLFSIQSGTSYVNLVPSATSTFASGIQVSGNGLSINGTGAIWSGSTATSTLAGGLNITGGCFSISSTCIGGLSGGSANTVAFWTGATTLSTNANFSFDNTNTRLGIGTSTPGARFSLSSLTTTSNDSFLLSGINQIYASSSTSTVLSDIINAFSFATTTVTNTSIPPIFSIGSFGGLPRIGIATSTPGAMFAINTLGGAIPFWIGSSTVASTTFIIDSIGNVGIGTSSPGSMLSLAGVGGGTRPLFMLSTTTVGNVVNTALVIDSQGKVGIGTTTPSFDFSVAGRIFAGSGITLPGGALAARAPTIQTFTASGTWTKPAGVTKIFVEVWGGGGGGGTESASNLVIGGGGGGGGYCARFLDVTASTTETVTIGAAGSAGSGGAGGSGGTSTFGACSATGGAGGQVATDGAGGVGGVPGAGAGGDLNFTGSGGQAGGDVVQRGTGGMAPRGGGGNQSGAGSVPGGGGSGGTSGGTVGAGGAGMIIVTEY